MKLENEEKNVNEEMENTVEVAANSEELNKLKEELDEKEPISDSETDTDFYTRSMDLSDQDFEMDDEFKDKKMPLGIKLLIFLIILIVLAAVFYFIWKLI